MTHLHLNAQLRLCIWHTHRTTNICECMHDAISNGLHVHHLRRKILMYLKKQRQVIAPEEAHACPNDGAFICPCVHAYMYEHEHMHTCVRYIHACMYAYIHACRHAHIRTRSACISSSTAHCPALSAFPVLNS